MSKTKQKITFLNIYYATLISSMSLLAIGLVMVLSASTSISFNQTGNQYEIALKQLLFAAIGLSLMYITSKLPVTFFIRWSNLLIFAAFVLLLLVLIPGIGVAVAGQRNWIDLFGPFRLQPSEFAKLAFIIWAAAILGKKSKTAVLTWGQLLYPVYWVGMAIAVLVLAQGDIGTAIIIVPIVLAVYFALGAPLVLNVVNFLLGVVAIAVLSIQAPYRMARWIAWLDPQADPEGAGWQIIQSKYALAEGGLFGLGLGASKQKWGWLPAAHTDFIFAVVGEELGLIGTILILFLIATLTIALLHLARKTSNNFTRLVAAGVAGWFLFQSLINLGGVLGILPITGVPLPLVSYGGSSLIFVLVAIGVILSCLRNEPELKQHFKSKKVKA
jgi:cell division protein FtsW